MAIVFAKRTEQMKRSEIREILKLTAQPEMISFAGGLPAKELFPVENMQQAAQRVLETMGREALQYSTTEGYVPLREKIAARSNRLWKTNVAARDVQVVTGSQQALDFIGKVFLDEGDAVICESPTYLGALSAFRSYEPRFVEVDTDSEGMVPEALERVLQQEKKAKIIYVIPDFQNPTGQSWSLERRKALMDLACKYEIPVVEDNPYGELRFEGEHCPSLSTWDTKGLVITLGTFSKILAPGLRVAWIIAPEEVLERIIQVKQGADLQTPTITQMMVDAYLDMFDIDKHVDLIIELYRERRNVMAEAFKTYLGDAFTFNAPSGGLFFWGSFTSGIGNRKVLERCIEKKVAFVPGDAFYPQGGHESTLRLNYSCMAPDLIREGVKRMGEALRELEG